VVMPGLSSSIPQWGRGRRGPQPRPCKRAGKKPSKIKAFENVESPDSDFYIRVHTDTHLRVKQRESVRSSRRRT
jgi:hypothetical protein